MRATLALSTLLSLLSLSSAGNDLSAFSADSDLPSTVGNATVHKAALPSHARRAKWAANLRALGKKGRIAGQWYPGYASNLLPIDEIEWSTVDVMVWFVQVTAKGGLVTDLDGPLDSLVAAASKHNVPVLATAGGRDGSVYMSSLVKDDAARTKLVSQVAAFVDDHGLSGFEFDWQYPGKQGIGCNEVSSSDLPHFGVFLAELRKKLGEDLLLTIDVPVSGLVGTDGTVSKNLGKWSEPLDFVSILNDDTFGWWTTTTGPNSPLSDACSPKDAKTGAIQSVSLYASSGIPKNKILLGMPGYGYAFTTTQKGLATQHYTVQLKNGKSGKVATQMFQAKTAKQPKGDLTDGKGKNVCGKVEGFWGFYLYKSLLNYRFLNAAGTKGLNGFTRTWDECTSTPFIYNESNNTFIGYEDANSMAIKASWAQDEGLAGVMVFDATGPTQDLFDAIRLAGTDRKALWKKGLMTVENATVVKD